MRVLLAEHQPGLIKAIKSGLEKEGLKVDVAKNDSQARNLASANDYDALLVDFHLPKVGGPALVQHWRDDGTPVSIIMLVRSRNSSDRVDSLNAGSDNCLTVPFAFAELLALLRVQERRKRQPVRIADLEIDPVGRSVRRSGRNIKLTPREFDLLELLALHRGRVVTRSLIEDKFYGNGEKTYSNVIPVYINFLRNKIDKGFETPLILTRWGEGYMLRRSD